MKYRIQFEIDLSGQEAADILAQDVEDMLVEGCGHENVEILVIPIHEED